VAGAESQGFNDFVGMRIVEAGADSVELSLTIEPRHHQVHGIVHGGVWCTLIETAASIGAGVWLGDAGDAVGVSNQTDFLRVMRTGTATARATPIHRGRRQQLWLVVITDDEGERVVARGQVRIQNVESARGLGVADVS